MSSVTPPTISQILEALKEWKRYGELDRLLTLLDRVNLSDLPRLDQGMRDVLSGFHPLDNPEWTHAQADRFSHTPGLLAVLASHPDGRFRERAVTQLAHVRTGLATGLLLVRLNDWVAPVRRRAEEALLTRLSVADLPLLLPNLPLVMRLLENVRAPNLELVLRVLALLETPEGLRQLLAVFPGLSPATRLLLARQVLAGGTPPLAMVRLFLKDPVGAVRLTVLRTLNSEELPSLLADPDARVRATVLSRLLQLHPPEELHVQLLTALLDPREAVRQIAAYALQGQRVDLRQTLLSVDPVLLTDRQLAGWLAALSTYGTAQDVSRVEPFVIHARTGVRVEALHALGRLDARRYVGLISEALLGTNPVSRVASRALDQAGLLTPSVLRQLWPRATTPLQQVRLISLSQRLGRFEAATMLLEWQDHAFQALLQRMDEAVVRLLDGHGRSHYTAPPVGLLTLLRTRAAQHVPGHPLRVLSTRLAPDPPE